MSLQALLAAQKAKKESPDVPTETPSAPAAQVETGSESVSPPKTGLAFLKAANKPAEVAAPAKESGGVPAVVPAAGLGFLKNRIGSSAPTQEKRVSVLTPEPKTPVATPSQAVTGKAEPMGDLDRLLNSEQPTHKSRFQDEIPATGPARDLPPELEPAGKAFVDSLDSIYRVIHEPDLLGGVVRGIMIELQNHPEYRKLIAPSDMHTMVRGMRESMGLARIKKEESKAKRSPKAKKTEINDLAVLEALEGMDFS